MNYEQKFKEGEEVMILDNDDEINIHWVFGKVLEVGVETIYIKWNDLINPSEHGLDEFDSIKHKQP